MDVEMHMHQGHIRVDGKAQDLVVEAIILPVEDHCHVAVIHVATLIIIAAHLVVDLLVMVDMDTQELVIIVTEHLNLCAN